MLKGTIIVASVVSPDNSIGEKVLPSEDYVSRAMPYRLGTFDMTMTFLMIMFFINNPVETVSGGAAAFSYWTIGTLVFFVPCLIVTAQLGNMFPHEGSLYNWTYKALGAFWSLFVGTCFWAPGILGMVTSASIAVTFLQGLNNKWLAEPQMQGALIGLFSFSRRYWHCNAFARSSILSISACSSCSASSSSSV